MFHKNLKPEDVLKRMMSDAADTLERLDSAEYPLDSIPPHHIGVFLVLDPDDKDYIALGKSNPRVLTHVEPDLWGPTMLFHLESETSAVQHAIGTFLGVVGKNDDAPEDPIIIGVLVSPTGEESVGAYVSLDAIDKPKKLWKEPKELLPQLNFTYEPLIDAVEH